MVSVLPVFQLLDNYPQAGGAVCVVVFNCVVSGVCVVLIKCVVSGVCVVVIK